MLFKFIQLNLFTFIIRKDYLLTLPAQDGKITVVKWMYLMEKLKENMYRRNFT